MHMLCQSQTFIHHSGWALYLIGLTTTVLEEAGGDGATTANLPALFDIAIYLHQM